MNDSIFELTIQRIMDEAKTGVNAGALSSFFKYYGTEQNVSCIELMTAITGSVVLYGRAKTKRLNKPDCFVVRNTIEEELLVQLGIIAKRILNLPS